MKKSTIYQCILIAFLLTMFGGCITAPSPPVSKKPTPEEAAKKFIDSQSEVVNAKHDINKKDEATESDQLPVRYQQPTYVLDSSAETELSSASEARETNLPIGADIQTVAGPKPLRVILDQIVAMKNLSTSYATDVDQTALVNVNVRAEQDFFKALDNILRPLDYFYEFEENTIIVSHKQTRTYQIAMPFMTSIYSTGIGGNVVGSSGTIQISSSGNEFDIWKNIRENLDKILDVWTAGGSDIGEEAPTPAPTNTTANLEGPGDTGESTPSIIVPQQPVGKGYYTIDKPIGLLTVTAPRSLLAKIEIYLDNLKKELYRQVSIEAKIVEVSLSDDNTSGVDWSNFLSENAGVAINVDYGKIKPRIGANTQSSLFTINSQSFLLIIDAMKKLGNVEVLANPKIRVMNGQPAMISVGETERYVSNVTKTVDDKGNTSYAVSTADAMNGIGLGVIATILEDDDIILNLTPVTSETIGEIPYYEVGGSRIGLPKMSVRELNTMVRVKDGEMLVVGGLISQSKTYSETGVYGLDKVPVLGRLFQRSGEIIEKKELVILLKPKIISMF